MPGNVLFQAEKKADVDRFIREYIVDVSSRAKEIDGCDGVSFDRDIQQPPDGNAVALIVFGDFETFVESEQELWATHQESGLIETWETKPLSDEQLAWKFGEQGTELTKRLMSLGGEMSKLAYEQFDDEPFPNPTDTFPEDDGVLPIGWWLVAHHVTVGNLGYTPTDEIEMCLTAMEEDLRIIADRQNADAVDAKLDEIIDALEGMREDVTDGYPRPEAASQDE